jgi:diamine N-acetyltransferase
MNSFFQYGKISLRPLEPDDIDLLYYWENNVEIWELSNTKTPVSKHILTTYILDSYKDIYELKQLRLIIQNEESTPVGAVDLYDFDPFNERAGVGILIHNKAERQKGYAIDALLALTNYSKNVLGLKQLFASIAEDNLASVHLFEKAGFIQTGIKKNWLKHPTGWKNELFFQKFFS